MTDEEKRGMKAACVQAAATLIAARDSRRPGGIDLDECANLAALLYVRVVAVDWRGSAAAVEETLCDLGARCLGEDQPGIKSVPSDRPSYAVVGRPAP